MEYCYNPKIDYLFCKYLNEELPSKYDERDYRDAYYNNAKGESLEISLMMKGKEILDYIKKEEVNISIKNVDLCYYILTHKKISEKEKNKLKMLLINYKTNDIQLFKEIIFNEVFKLFNNEMAKIILTFSRLKKGLVPLFIYPYNFKVLCNTIKYKEEERFLHELTKVYEINQKINKKHAYISSSEIKEKLLNISTTLEEKFGIEELYIFGSFSKNTENEYSDLDIVIKINEIKKKDIFNFEKIICYFKDYFQIDVDIKTNEDFNTLTVDMIRNIKRIF